MELVPRRGAASNRCASRTESRVQLRLSLGWGEGEGLSTSVKEKGAIKELRKARLGVRGGHGHFLFRGRLVLLQSA